MAVAVKSLPPLPRVVTSPVDMPCAQRMARLCYSSSIRLKSQQKHIHLHNSSELPYTNNSSQHKQNWEMIWWIRLYRFHWTRKRRNQTLKNRKKKQKQNRGAIWTNSSSHMHVKRTSMASIWQWPATITSLQTSSAPCKWVCKCISNGSSCHLLELANISGFTPTCKVHATEIGKNQIIYKTSY